MSILRLPSLDSTHKRLTSLTSSPHLSPPRHLLTSNRWGRPASRLHVLSGALLFVSAVNPLPDLVAVFAAGNGGGALPTLFTISPQAAAKNAIAVGAVSDGLVGHLAKTLGSAAAPSLYSPLDGRACPAVIATVAGLNAPAAPPAPLTPAAPFCPASVAPATAPTDAQCYQMYLVGANQVSANVTLPSPGDGVTPVPGGFGGASVYALGTAAQAELPLCCGCALTQVVSGCVASGDCDDGANPGQLSILLQRLVSTYNARLPMTGAALGPASGGAVLRIKPDLAATGIQLVSARSGRNTPYGAFTCAAAGTTFRQSAAAGAPAFAVPPPPTAAVGAAPTVPLPAGLTGLNPLGGVVAQISIQALTEPVRVVSVGIPVASIVPPGAAGSTATFYAQFVSTTEVGGAAGFQPFPASVTLAGTATATVITIPVGLELGAGWAGSLVLMATEGVVITTSLPPVGTPVGATVPACFSPGIGVSTLVELTTLRGGGLGYTTAQSGTSFAAPLVAGAAALVRQYYAAGYANAAAPGTPVAAAGFGASAALVKATLINSATPLLSAAYDTFFSSRRKRRSITLRRAATASRRSRAASCLRRWATARAPRARCPRSRCRATRLRAAWRASP